NVMLYRYSGQEDFTIGSPVAGRQQAETEDMIGFFINTVALRSEIDGEISFNEFLQKVKNTTLEAYEHQDVPFEKIVDAVVKQRDMSRSPLFQVSFMLQNTPEVPELKLGDAILKVEEFSNNISKIDITFSLTETPDGIEGNVEYCTDLYTEETILRMTSHFKELLASILKAPDQKIGSLNMITEKEERQLLVEFNDNERKYPKEKTIVDIIEEYGIDIPDYIALDYENEKVTYIELNERANQFAHYLKDKGIKAETLVPICIDRSIEMIIAIFGILKAGAAYVPIDPEYPEDRMQFMLEDIDASLLVTSRKTFENGLILPHIKDLEIIEIDSEKDEISKHSNMKLQTEITPDNLAYVIYTSGSTGKPKGVMIEHKGVVNLSLSQEELLWLKPGMKTLQFASSGFDASCYDIFNTLLSKGSLVLCNKEDILSADKFQNLINEHGVELVTLPSSFQQTIKDSIEEMPSIKTIVSAGEALNIETAVTFRSNGIRIVNAYGPTETTVCASLTDDPIKEHNVVTIGKPNPNQQIYIVDKFMNVCPVGVPGEICVAGIQVARGYLNRPELSSEKFIQNPFNKGNSPKLYKTGDLGKWHSDGSIEYLGRIDDQIKLRGYRIELGEIENVLQQSEYVRQAVVMVKADEIGNRRLVGYIVPEGDFAIGKDEILNYIKKKLPEYMIPALWVEMESLPVTPSGKINRKALPEPEAGSVSAEYAAPRNETEKALSAIWKELLHAEQVGIHDNFFDLGGDSIITIQVQSRARRLGYELKPNDIFIHQTISSLSAALAERTETAVTGEQGILSGKCGLLPIQQWYFEGVTSDVSHFNQSVLLSIDKSVTQEVLDKAVNKLTVQHDALRFIYHINEENDNRWDQEYGFNTGKLFNIDLQNISKEDLGKEINDHSDKIQRSLDIEKGEIAKFVLFKTPESDDKNRILIVIHHLAVDGVSWRIILDDLEMLISGYVNNEEVDLGVKSSSYRQWYNALKEFSGSERLLSQSSYWENIVSDIEQISTDKDHSGEVKEKDMVMVSQKLDNIQTELLLHEVPRVYHTDINDILLCALAQTISE
ncbi:MAG: amino acid adenylation domain-containing protein, partial [Ignavibacteria bacterium]|nr:amino acid adenylation domain-containing protein [Ignavibacteria bacterium]